MMIQWDESFSVGVPALDQEHQGLFAIINRLFDEVSGKNIGSHENIRHILEELEVYSRTHFKHEEEWMIEQQCPGLEEQKRQHHFFVERVQGLEKKLQESRFEEMVSAETWIFLKNWLNTHILDEDRKYDPRLRK